MKASYAKYARLRDERGLNDLKVSEAAGISRATISQWKAELYTPKVEKISAIAKLFGVHLEELYEGIEHVGNRRCDGVSENRSSDRDKDTQHEGLSDTSEGEIRDLSGEERCVHRMVDGKEMRMYSEQTRKLLSDLNDCIATIDRCKRELEETEAEIMQMYLERRNEHAKGLPNQA